MEAFFIKKANGSLFPASEEDAELLSKIKLGKTVKLTLTRTRNVKYHRKYFALLNLAFDYWTPPEKEVPVYMRGQQPEKNLDTFRSDITILAGFYDATYRLNGDTKLVAKSISFYNMSEDNFEKLFSATIDVVINRICTQYTEHQLRRQVENLVLDFV